ncbi:hypothetical protein EMCRGX_G015384 [Ephydatia muelleri]
MICILGGSPASAGLDTTCQEKILSSFQSLQDQIAVEKLYSYHIDSCHSVGTTEGEKDCQGIVGTLFRVVMVILHTEPRPFIANIQSAIHSPVKHLHDQTENATEWNTSLSLKRRSKMVLAGKLDESKKRQRKVQRKHKKAHSRMNACTTSTEPITAEEKNEATKILTVDFMSSEETGQETAGSDNERAPPVTIFKIRPCPWRSDRANSIIASMDRKAQRRSSDRAKKMCHREKTRRITL